jgi:hypothetical protein
MCPHHCCSGLYQGPGIRRSPPSVYFGKSLMTYALMALLLSLALPTAAHAGPAATNSGKRCGGVVMVPNLPTEGDNHKAFIEHIGIYKVSGGLLPHREHYCQMVDVECTREAGKCRAAFAMIVLPKGKPPELGVYMTDDYKITMWTTNRISAERPTPIGGKSEIYITLNDQTPDDVQMMNIVPKISNSGELTTDVLTIDQR